MQIVPRRLHSVSWALLLVLAAAYGYLLFLQGGAAAVAGFLAIGVGGGLLSRSWWTIVLIPLAMTTGAIGRGVGGAGWATIGPPYDDVKMLLLGKAAAGFSIGFVGTVVVMSVPIALGGRLRRRLARRGRSRSLADLA